MNTKNFKKRDNLIRKLHSEKKLSYASIARKFDLTSERVSQICSSQSKPTKDQLISLVKKAYLKKLRDKNSLKELLEDIVELSKADRTKETVIRRRFLVCFLKDELELPFLQIASLVHRDHTSIMNLYYSNKTT